MQAQLESGSGGLALSIYQLNGGYDLNGLRDSKVGDLIKNKVPQNTFEEIDVNTVNYKFEGEMNFLRARKITLKRAITSVCLESMRAFLMTFFGNKGTEHQRYDSPIDASLIKDRLLGNDNSADVEEEIRKAYIRCQIITLIISDDCNFAEIRMDQSQIFIIARKIAEKVEFCVKMGTELLPILLKDRLL